MMTSSSGLSFNVKTHNTIARVFSQATNALEDLKNARKNIGECYQLCVIRQVTFLTTFIVTGTVRNATIASTAMAPQPRVR